MAQATLEKPKIDERDFICGLSPLAPVAFLEIPVSRESGANGRRLNRAVQFAFSTTHYNGDADMTGISRFGRTEKLTEAEIGQIWDYVSHRVVRWFGKPSDNEQKDDRHPDITDEHGSKIQRPGYGPNGAYTSGRIMDTRDVRYTPDTAKDTPLEPYIVMRPVRAEDRGVIQRDAPIEGGRAYFEKQLDEAARKPVSTDEQLADRDQRIRELEALLAAEQKKTESLELARQSEREDVQDGKRGRRG